MLATVLARLDIGGLGTQFTHRLEVFKGGGG